MPILEIPRRTAAGRALARAAAAERSAGSRGPWLLAFSGGPDSLALALALAAADVPELILIHVDHGLDAGSGSRAARAVELARALRRPVEVVPRRVEAERRRGENLEAAARRVRYDALERARHRYGADRILTGHHRDDQVETVLLRMLSGSGLFGLGGIRARSGALWRPALELRRAALAEIVTASGLVANLDPSNLDLARARNRIRLALLPFLRRQDPDIEERLAALAGRAAAARERLATRLASACDLRSDANGASLLRDALAALPGQLALLALQLLEERAGFSTPSSTRARRELLRQLEERPARRLPAFAGRRWTLEPTGRVVLRGPAENAGGSAAFSYTLTAPGEVAIPELGGRCRLRTSPVEPWMRRGEAHRAALRLPATARCEVRNRRPGDRLRPLGAPGMRTLKDLLIDRKVPRAERDRIPLLVVDGRLAWVQGITIEDDLRLRDDRECWVIEWLPEPNQGGAAARSTLSPHRDAIPEEGKP